MELGAHLRQDARLVAAAHRAHQEGAPRPHPRRVDHGRLGQRQGAAALAGAGERLPGRWGRRVRAQPLVSAHGPPGHGVERRQGCRTDFGGDAGGQGSRARAGLVQAHAVDHRHRRRSPRVVCRRRGRDRLVEHVPVAAAHRSGDARVRGQRRWIRVERRAGRAGHPSAVTRENGADDAGVPRQIVFRHRRHRRLHARPELLSAGVRNRSGLHRGDARSCHRPERHSAARRRPRRVPRRQRVARMDVSRRLQRPAPRPRRPALEDQAAGREGVLRRAGGAGRIRAGVRAGVRSPGSGSGVRSP